MPTISPGRRAGGFTRGTVDEDMQSEACMEIYRLTQKKFAPAHQPRRPPKEYTILFFAHDLRSAGSVYPHGRLRLASRDRRRRCRARTRSRRLRFPYAALKEAHSHIVLAIDRHQFHVHAVLP